MTIRLVALMSVVLLLSLAALGLMMNHYQDQVMQEVARTVSEVGRATLRTLEMQADPQRTVEDGEPRPVREVRVWHERRVAAAHEAADGGEARGVVVRELAGVASPGDPGDSRRVMPGTASGPVASGTLHTVRVLCETDESSGEEHCTSDSRTIDAGAETFSHLFIAIDDVAAETDPTQGLVLKIPRFTPDVDPSGGETTVRLEPALDATSDDRMSWTRHEEIRLPVPVEDFQALFGAVRRRSLWLFLGVFMVGTVLSAGLASRFTRPVRRLDAAIRRLSAGDLDVQVATRGEDEIARLGRAFNEMTRSLRASRARAREIVRKEKHSALGRLAAGVAHDIRNPLHSIGLTLQHLNETCRPEAAAAQGEFDRSLEIIRAEIRRLDKLVGDFLRFAKSDVRQRQPVELAMLLQETARLVRKEAEWRRVELQLDLAEGVGTPTADGEALRSSILNLVLNSFEAMPDGGKLTLVLRAEPGAAVVEVGDTGHGIGLVEQDRVFEFAYTTREGGNGLGLAMVHQCVVEDHGGQVALDSAPGRGTRVTLTLPLALADSEVRC